MRNHTVCLILLVVLVCPFASAQWVPVNGPYVGRINCFAASGTKLFAGTDGGVFLSTDNGSSWTAVNNGLTNTSVRALAVGGTNLFARTDSGTFLSTNNGTSWTTANTPFRYFFQMVQLGTNVALWLEAHSPGEPLNFLDHHIKCGNSIIGFVRREELEKGVPDEAFATLPGDDGEFASALRKRNKAERAGQEKLRFNPEVERQIDEVLKGWRDLDALPEHTPEQVEAKRQRFERLSKSLEAQLMEQLASIPIAQFYIPKVRGSSELHITDDEFRRLWDGERTPESRAAEEAWEVAVSKRFFHWFLGFPDVIARGGFHCLLGKPPYLGGQSLSSTFGHPFCKYVKWEYAPTGLSDLVVLWSLSYLWAGWLFGSREAGRLRELALQKWPDWAWYQSVMTAALRALRPLFRFDGVCALILPGAASQQVFAVSLAALMADYEVESWQYRAAGEHQLVLRPAPLHAPRPQEPETLHALVMAESARAVVDALNLRGEPMAAEWLGLAAWQQLLHKGVLETARASLPVGRVLSWLTTTVGKGLEAAQAGELVAVAEDEGRPLGWWLKRVSPQVANPLGDRVEEALLSLLRQAGVTPVDEAALLAGAEATARRGLVEVDQEKGVPERVLGGRKVAAGLIPFVEEVIDAPMSRGEASFERGGAWIHVELAFDGPSSGRPETFLESVAIVAPLKSAMVMPDRLVFLVRVAIGHGDDTAAPGSKY